MRFQTVQFKAGSYILVEGKRDNDRFYIILDGQLRTQKSAPVAGEEQQNLLGPGDFFGVESAMSRQSRIETVIAQSNCKLIEVPAEQFGTLIEKNAPVAMKIIRSFSVKLRAFDSTITRLSFRSAAGENPSHLFNLGEHWYQENRKEHSVYAYQRYLQHLPNGDHVEQVKMKLNSMNKALTPPVQNDTGINRNYALDSIIFCENELGYELYIIQSGRVKISKMVEGQEMMLAVLQAGDIFGEMALLDNKPRTATAVAADQVVVLAINKANFETMVKEKPQLATRLITLLSERIWTAYRQLENLVLGDRLGRLYHALLTNAEKNHAQIHFKATYTFDFGGTDLLKMVGMDPQKDESYLLKLLKNRWLRLDQGRIICSDLLELQKQVAFYTKKTAMEKKRQEAATGRI